METLQKISEARASKEPEMVGYMAYAVLAVHAGRWQSNEPYEEAYARALGYPTCAELSDAPCDEVDLREKSAVARLIENLNVERSSNYSEDDGVRFLFDRVPQEIKDACLMWLVPTDARL
jgi:hypothetical protein